MKRTTVKLPDDLDAKLRREADRRGLTMSELTREAIETYLGVGVRRRLAGTASGASGRGDLSVRVEEILAQEAEPFAERGGDP